MSDSNFSSCKHLKKFLNAEMKVITDHLSEHKWFQHIADDDQAMIDFIGKYGWIMREMYCGFACHERHDCEIARRFLPKENEDEETQVVSDGQ